MAELGRKILFERETPMGPEYLVEEDGVLRREGIRRDTRTGHLMNEMWGGVVGAEAQMYRALLAALDEAKAERDEARTDLAEHEAENPLALPEVQQKMARYRVLAANFDRSPDEQAEIKALGLELAALSAPLPVALQEILKKYGVCAHCGHSTAALDEERAKVERLRSGIEDCIAIAGEGDNPVDWLRELLLCNPARTADTEGRD